MRTRTLNDLRQRLRPSRVYRRADLTEWSGSIDRHLRELVKSGDLRRLRKGLYYCPRRLAFGEVPPSERALLQAFLKTDRFVSPNLYNQLGVGTTQLYDKRGVYNHQRHGTLDLGGHRFYFARRTNVPRKLTEEILLVDLVNELNQLAEDRMAVLARVRQRANRMDDRKLSRAVKLYAKRSTRRSWQALGYG